MTESTMPPMPRTYYPYGEPGFVCKTDYDKLVSYAQATDAALQRSQEDLKRYQNSADCVGTGCKAIALRERAEQAEQRAAGLENELARLENGSECCPRGNYLQSKKQAAEAQADDLARQLAEVAKPKLQVPGYVELHCHIHGRYDAEDGAYTACDKCHAAIIELKRQLAEAREECAKVCEQLYDVDIDCGCMEPFDRCVAAIRSMGK